MPYKRGTIYHDITYYIVMTVIERKSDFIFTLNSPPSPSRASYGVSLMIMLTKMDLVIVAPHCICYANIYRWTQECCVIESAMDKSRSCMFATLLRCGYIMLNSLHDAYTSMQLSVSKATESQAMLIIQERFSLQFFGVTAQHHVSYIK